MKTRLRFSLLRSFAWSSPSAFLGTPLFFSAPPSLFNSLVLRASPLFSLLFSGCRTPCIDAFPSSLAQVTPSVVRKPFCTSSARLCLRNFLAASFSSLLWRRLPLIVWWTRSIQLFIRCRRIARRAHCVAVLLRWFRALCLSSHFLISLADIRARTGVQSASEELSATGGGGSLSSLKSVMIELVPVSASFCSACWCTRVFLL